MKEEKFSQAKGFLPYLVCFILGLLFFAPFFLEGKAFVAADTLLDYYPWKAYNVKGALPRNKLLTDSINEVYPAQYNRRLKEGMPYKWNPFILTGVAATRSVSMGVPGPFYPIKVLLHKLLPAYAASTLLLFIHVVLMGAFMHMYLIEIGAGWRGALFGGIAYMFNGCAMVWLELELWVTVSALLPLLLFCIEKYLSEKRFVCSLAAGGVLGLMFLTGSMQLVVYIGLLLMFYSVFVLIRAYRRSRAAGEVIRVLSCFAITAGTGLLIGAVEILPFMELVSNSSRINRSFDFQDFFKSTARIPLRYFVTLFFPDFFGNPILHLTVMPRLVSQKAMLYNELGMYMGIPTMFALAAAIVAPKDYFSRFYIFITVFVAAMFTGTYVYYPFFRLVPGMDKMNPSRLIFLFVFAVSVLSAMGINGIKDLTPKRSRILIGVFIAIVAGASVLAFLGGRPHVTAWFNQELFLPLTKVTAYYIDKLIQLRKITSEVIYKPLALTLISFCLFSFMVLAKARKAGGYFFSAIILLLSFDLMSYGRAYNTTTAPEYIYPKTPAIDFLLAQPRPFRVVQDIEKDFHYNTLVPFGIEEVGGYAGVYPDRINRLMSYLRVGESSFQGKTFDRWVAFDNFSSRLFNMMNVKYVLTSSNSILNDARFRLVYKNEIAVYENLQVMPRAYVAGKYIVKKGPEEVLRHIGSDGFDMRNEVVLEEDPEPAPQNEGASALSSPRVEIEKHSPDEVVITAELSAPGWLVLSDTYYPGWQAEVDGKNAKIYRANCNFRAVSLPAGRHNVIFSYRPRSHRIGLTVTLTGILFACSGMAFAVLRRRT